MNFYLIAVVVLAMDDCVNLRWLPEADTGDSSRRARPFDLTGSISTGKPRLGIFLSSSP